MVDISTLSLVFSKMLNIQQWHDSTSAIQQAKRLPFNPLLSGHLRAFFNCAGTIQSDNEGGLMYLLGRLNMESSPALRDHLLALLRWQSPPAITIDLAGVSMFRAHTRANVRRTDCARDYTNFTPILMF